MQRSGRRIATIDGNDDLLRVGFFQGHGQARQRSRRRPKGGRLTEGSVIERRMGPCAVADALRNGNIEALFELGNLLEESGARENARSFVLQVICELLPEDGQDSLLAGPQAQRHKNVIDLATRKPLG